MDGHMFCLLHKTLVRPHLEYAKCVWNPFLRQDITKLEKVQRRATKMVPSIKALPCMTRLERHDPGIQDVWSQRRGQR